jgi:transcriptional regulator with PAS, ATPase and Fis domain
MFIPFVVFAATPDSGTLMPSSSGGASSISWTGGPYTAITADPSLCTSLSCDECLLTVNISSSFYTTNPDFSVRVHISWADTPNDFDLYVYDADGNLVNSSAQGNTTFEDADLGQLTSGTFRVQVVAFSTVNELYSRVASVGPPPVDQVRLAKYKKGRFTFTQPQQMTGPNGIVFGVQGSGGVGRRNAVHINPSDVTLIGKSPAIEDVRSAIDLVANSQTAVLITGESGTGKEVAARLIHLKSERSQRPFVAINCAALPRDVIENELFGHEKGAFTGAVEKKSGCFELANTGTLFFDEIAEMNPDTQAKLLRAIEQKAFRRLGGKEEINVDVRMVAATNKNIAVALRSRELREDLYYRFSVIEIYMPPLRERREDIPLLVDHFFAMFKEKYGRTKQSLSRDAMKFLVEYNWPGNVRELRNVLERVVVTGPNGSIHAAHLSQRILKNESGNGYTINIPIGTSAEEAERQLILQTLTYVKNNKSKAALMLGVSRKTLHNKLNAMAEKNKAQ